MATEQQKMEAEQQIRDLLDRAQLPQPDDVEYGHTCVRLFWHEPKQIVVIQIDEPPPGWRFAEELTTEELEAVKRGERLRGEDDLDW